MKTVCIIEDFDSLSLNGGSGENHRHPHGCPTVSQDPTSLSEGGQGSYRIFNNQKRNKTFEMYSIHGDDVYIKVLRFCQIEVYGGPTSTPCRLP
jgi:hypothetical protein